MNYQGVIDVPGDKSGNSSTKSQGVNILDCAGHSLCITTTQLCCYIMKMSIDNMQINEYVMY